MSIDDEEGDEEEASFQIDAIDGGYFVAVAGPDDEERVPRIMPAGVGEVLVDGNMAVVNSLGGADLDERVMLHSMRDVKEPTQERLEYMGRGAFATARFHLFADGPLVVMSNDLEYQGRIATPTEPLDLELVIFMRIDPEPLEPGSPHEIHTLIAWPSDAATHPNWWWSWPT